MVAAGAGVQRAGHGEVESQAEWDSAISPTPMHELLHTGSQLCRLLFLNS